MTGRPAGGAPRAHPRLLLAWVGSAACFAVALGQLEQPSARLLGHAVNAAALLGAAPVLVVLARRRRRGRAALVAAFMAAATALLGTGRLLALLETPEVGVALAVGHAAPFAVGAALAVMSLALILRGHGRLSSLRAVAEVGLLTALAVLLAVAVARAGLADADLQDADFFLLQLAWPVICAPQIALALRALASPLRGQAGPVLLALGVQACYVAFHTGAARLMLGGSADPSGTALEAFPLLATGLIVLAVLGLDDRPHPQRPLQVPAAQAPVVLGVVLSACVVLLWTGRAPGPVEGGLALLAGVLVMLRQLAADLDEARLQRHLYGQARTDQLTGLVNRAGLLERVEEVPDGALVLLDLDGFKAVNDGAGHVAGDAVLRDVADRLVAAAGGLVGERGAVARLGGDEFALLVEDATRAEDVARGAVRSVEAGTRCAGPSTDLSASAGIARTAGSPSADVLLDRADVAMYASKGAGRGVTTWWSEDLGATVREQQRLRRDLRAQLLGDAEQLSVVHQPVLDLTDGRVIGAEALVRWHHPELGTVSPGVFVPLVEAEGLSRQLSERVLELACADAARWRAAGHDVRLAVNLCGDELVDDLPERLLTVLGRHDLPGSSLVLELTERTLVDAGERTVALLRRIHDLGPRVALDDFGAGFSALAYLSRLPLQIIKLDRSLVAGLHADHGAAVVVEAVLALAARLGLRVVAEGVEVADELEALRRLGCPAAQGYHLGRPAPADDLLARLDADRARRQADVAAALPRQVDRSPATRASAAS